MIIFFLNQAPIGNQHILAPYPDFSQYYLIKFKVKHALLSSAIDNFSFTDVDIQLYA